MVHARPNSRLVADRRRGRRERLFTSPYPALEIDLERGPTRGGELKIITAIRELPVIVKVLARLGMDPPPPPKALALEPGRKQTG